ncbi:hypothetical protein SAMN05660330_00257 [Desulforhopalus singaporensis]|uniref:Uncharacterized protein n=1 Tax=Desulforhopalus singaporensis TaxID=91360 RepID=A0A1H0JND7_9BACT|nr:hypothetical protein SAMN05660330_00257 [Desulforhopalus singaporensis]
MHPIKAFLNRMPIFISSLMTTGKGGCDLAHCRTDLARAVQGKTGSYGENDVHPRRIPVPLNPERFPDNSFNAISLYRTANFTVNAYSDPAFSRGIRQADQTKPFTVKAFPPTVNSIKLPSLPDEVRLQESLIGQVTLKVFSAPWRGVHG